MVLTSVLLYVVLPVAIAIYIYFKKSYRYFSDRGIPHLKPKFPMGNIQGMNDTRHMLDIIHETYEKCKGKDVLAGIYSFAIPIYIVTDLELVKNIMIRDFNSFLSRPGFVNEKDEPLTGHLFALNGEKWRFLRHKLSGAFTSGKMKLMYHTISSKGNNFVDAIDTALEQDKAINIKDLSNCFTVDAISSVAFGMEANTMKGEHMELVRFLKEVFKLEGLNLIRFFLMMIFPNVAKFLKMKLLAKDMSDFFMGVVSKNIENREKTKDERQDFLNMLIQLKNKGSIDGEFSIETRKITLNEAIAQAFVFYFGGADSTAISISFAIAELAHNPEIQERLRVEIMEATKGEKGEIDYETLQGMTYLNQVMDETLRMYTNQLVLSREATEDYKVPNSKHVIKKGAVIWIPTIGIHYDERYYKNPYKFDPDRFTPEEVASRPNYTNLAFGDGPRNCIGMRYALLTAKYAVVTILRDFKVTPDARMHYPIKFNPKNPLLEPLGGYWVRLERL